MNVSSALVPGLARYVPRHVLAAVAGGAAMHNVPVARGFEGVALMLDIAGFSTLTEDFAREGAAGAERLSAVLDAYFGRMTAIALMHGGDVVDFVGDAMLVVWETGGGTDLRYTATLAAQCGLAMQHALPEITARTAVDLRQRISLAGGALACFETGGVDGKWHCLTAGRPLAQAAAGNQEAAAGEVAVDAVLWLELQSQCDGRLLASGGQGVYGVHTPVALPPPLPAVTPCATPSVLERYIAQPLLERLRVGGGRWLGEFRDISTLFIGLPGIDCARDNALAVLQTAVECAQRVHQRYGGSLSRLSADDKGVTLLCAFGLPLMAREDDAVRAVSAACALAETLDGHGIISCMGITTGRVFFTDSGGNQRRHAGLVGGAVNLAARLMIAVRHGVLCDEATQHAAARAFTFEACAAITAKGFAAPVAVWRPRAAVASERRAFAGVSVGREAEFDGLMSRLAALAASERADGCVVLHGEAGIGKSRLIEEVAARARARGISVVWGAGNALEMATVYFPWRQMLTRLLCGDESFDAARVRDEAAQRLAGAGDERLRSWLPLLNDVLPLQFPDTGITQQMSGQARAASLRTLLLALVQSAAQARPLLLIADDMLWFDGASASLLSAVVATRAPALLVLAATRPLEASAAPEVQRFVDEAQCVALGALSHAAVSQLIAHKLDAAEVSPALAAFVAVRTAGNPFYVEEVVLALRAAHFVMVTAGVAIFAEGVHASTLEGLPDSLRGIIVSRIDALGAAEQQVLKVASVIGREFSLPMLRDLMPRTEASVAEIDLPEVARTLMREDVVRPLATGARDEYRFKHALLQDTVYEQLPFALRRELHGAVAGWIETREAGNLAPRYAALALHWERALNRAAAVNYYEQAAALSLRRYANRDAIAHAQRALRLADEHALPVDASREARCEGIVGDAYHELFEYRAATRHFKRALARAGRPVPRHTAMLALDLSAQLLLQLGARAGLSPASANDTALPWASHIHEKLGEIAYFEGRTLPLLHATLTSLNLAERSGVVREAVDGFAALAIGFYGAGQHRLSRLYNRRSLELANAKGGIEDVAYANLISGIYWAPQARWPEVEQTLAQSAALYTQIGAVGRWQQTRTVLCAAELIRGRFARAREVLDELQPSVHRDTPVQIVAWAHCFEMWLALARGDPLDTLAARLREATAARELQQIDRVFCLGVLASAYWRLGEREPAINAAREGLASLVASSPSAWYVTSGIAGIAQTLIAASAAGLLPGYDDARRACRALKHYARATQVAAPFAALMEGRLAHATGDTRRALGYWHKGLESARTLGAQYGEAWLRYEIGSNGEPGEAGREQMQQALALFDAIGAGVYANYVRGALQKWVPYSAKIH